MGCRETVDAFKDTWVCHCIIEAAEQLDKKPLKIITLAFHQASSQMPENLLAGKSRRCDMEIIHRSLPHRFVLGCYDVQHAYFFAKHWV